MTKKYMMNGIMATPEQHRKMYQARVDALDPIARALWEADVLPYSCIPEPEDAQAVVDVVMGYAELRKNDGG